MRFGIQSGFNIDTSLHFFKRGLTSIIKNMAINDPFVLPTTCSSIGLNYFDSCKKILQTLDSKEKNYDLHIWGHGWEIENFNLWNDLEDFFQFIVKNNYRVSRLKDIYV